MKNLLFAAMMMWSPAPSPTTGEDPKDVLQGVWQAKSTKADGKDAPEEAVKRIKVTFKGDKVVVGNRNDDTEEESDYTLDATKTPKQITIVRKEGAKPIQGIYKLKDEELTICIRHESSDEGRPTEFASTEGSKLVLIVLTKQKP